VTYEGTNQVKDSKISMLVHDYELFSMNEDGDIKSMFTRFTNITNALQSLDKTYSDSELVTAIEEEKNLSIIPLEDLLGSLMTHELTMKKRVDDEEKEKKKKNVVALKSSEIDDSNDDEDLALFTRKFKKFLANKRSLVENQIRNSIKKESQAKRKKSCVTKATS
ncbi:UBN2 domain-containing protein, partial [Cephalotus follicularis]